METNFSKIYICLIIISVIFISPISSACNSGCSTGACSVVDENCTTCKGSHRLLPTCGCELGYYDNGSNDCVVCDFKCSQCAY